MRSTTTFRKGQVVVVTVPFTGPAGAKLRPALVLSTDTFHRNIPDLIVCAISSQPRFFSQPGPGDHPLKQWKQTGLHYPSTARLSNLMAVDKRRITRILGSADSADLAIIDDGLRQVFRL